MADEPNNPAAAPAPEQPKKKRGGRKVGQKNKKTLERERAAQLEQERRLAIAKAEAMASPAEAEVARAAAQGKKLMKDIGIDFTMMFAGLAAFYQPLPAWNVAVDAAGQPLKDKRGVPILVNANPNYDEGKFVRYGTLAMGGARDFAAYESPKLAAVLLEQALVREILITGGLPDEQDGGLIDAAGNTHTIELGAHEYAEPGAGGIGHPAGGDGQGANSTADAAQGASGDLPGPG